MLTKPPFAVFHSHTSVVKPEDSGGVPFFSEKHQGKGGKGGGVLRRAVFLLLFVSCHGWSAVTTKLPSTGCSWGAPLGPLI